MTLLKRYFSSTTISPVSLNWVLSKLGIFNNNKVYYNQSSSKPLSSIKSDDVSCVNINNYNKLLKTIQLYNNNKEIYINDGLIGSSLSESLKIRTVSDTINISTLYNNILYKYPSIIPTKYISDLNIYHCSDLKLTSDELKLLGVSSNNILLLNTAKKTLLAVGNINSSFLQASIISYITSAYNGVILNGKLSNDVSSLILTNKEYYLLGNNGLSTAFGTAKTEANLYKSPSNIFIPTKNNDAPALSKITPAQAKSYFIATQKYATPVEGNAAGDKFVNLVTNSKADLYLVNETLVKNIDKLVTSVESGAMNKVTFNVDEKSGFQVPTSVTGLF